MIVVLAQMWLVLKVACWLQILRYNDGEKYSSHMDYFQDAVSCQFHSNLLFSAFLWPPELQVLCGFDALLTLKKNWMVPIVDDIVVIIMVVQATLMMSLIVYFRKLQLFFPSVTTRMSPTAAKSDLKPQHLAWYKLLWGPQGKNITSTNCTWNP